jgi:hypothetical protein
MTQFQPPPQPPDDAYAGSGGAPFAGAPVKWSAAAVSGFILSLLGCTGIGAVFGLILGVIGIVVTRGGRRRGRGLAIAAIPISLVTGAVVLVLGFAAVTMARKVTQATDHLPAIIGGEVTSQADAADLLLSLTTEQLRAEVGPEKAQAWLAQVAKKHGKLVEVEPSLEGKPSGRTSDGNIFLSKGGKFVNGRANIKIIFDAASVWTGARIADIEVDGVSLRESD